MRRAGTFEWLGFSVSLMFLSAFYGHGAAVTGFFPAPFFQRALEQAAVLLVKPHFFQPRVHEERGARVLVPEAVQPGATLIASVWEDMDWDPGLVLIDAEGRPLHRWHIAAAEIFAGPRNVRNPAHAPMVHGVHLFPNGDVLVNVEYVGTARLDACGNVLWTVQEDNHHSVARDEDGWFWIPATTISSEAPTGPGHPDGYPGMDHPMPHDRILQVSAEGEILRDISVLDILYENNLQRFLAKSRVSPGGDLIHLNDVEPLGHALADEYPLFEAGDLLLSIRNPNLVLVVDPQTLLVKWHLSEPFIQQHDPDFVGGGWVGVFDNARDGTRRGTLAGGSRIVMVQPHTDSIWTRFPTPRSDPFYTAIMGKWQLLEDGNLLLTESQAGRVVEVDPEGRTVWEWIAGPYEGDHVVEVSEGTRYPLGPADVAAWPCAQSPEDPPESQR